MISSSVITIWFTHKLVSVNVSTVVSKLNANAHRPTLTLDLTITSGVTRGWMARGSHSFTCHPHVYPRMEWAILHAFRKHSPDGVARARWRSSGSAYYSSIDPETMKGWVGIVGRPYSGWFTHTSGHPSASGRAWDRESSPLCHAGLIKVTAVKYAVKVVGNGARYRCCCYTPLVVSDMVYQMAPFPLTLFDLQGHTAYSYCRPL